MNKKIVVFGGCGFIGSYVVDELLKIYKNVIVADINHSCYIDKKHFIKCDILDDKQVNKIVQDADIVYNFAGLANIDDAIANPVKTIQLNVLGNLNILQACIKYHVKRFIFASSAYAMSNKGSFYGISKLSSEKLIEEYYKKYGLEFTIVRYGSVYGDREFENNYIYNLLKQAYLTKQINHEGDGEEIREYIHAYDVAKLVCHEILKDEYINEHVILTGLERMHRKELFDMINEILGDSISIKLKKDGYVNHYKTTPYSFSPTRSKKLVANPFIDMGQGMLECLKSIQQNYD